MIVTEFKRHFLTPSGAEYDFQSRSRARCSPSQLFSSLSQVQEGVKCEERGMCVWRLCLCFQWQAEKGVPWVILIVNSFFIKMDREMKCSFLLKHVIAISFAICMHCSALPCPYYESLVSKFCQIKQWKLLSTMSWIKLLLFKLSVIDFDKQVVKEGYMSNHQE